MTPHLFSTSRLPLVIGHRGVVSHAPENSTAGFAIAADRSHLAACDGVELDIHCTADGVLIVHHDPVLLTGEPIASALAAKVGEVRLSDGSAIPTLNQVLDVVADLEVFIEAKHLPAGADATLLQIIRDHPAVSCHVHAFDHRVIARLRRGDATLSLGVLSRSYPVDAVQQVHEAGADTLWQEAHLIDADLVLRCRAGGVRVIAWTVTAEEEARRLLGLGVSGLCGDAPEMLKHVVAAAAQTKGRP